MSRNFEFTFPDSGITVVCKRVSPFLRDRFTAALSHEEPNPPVELITVAGPLQGTEQANKSDPEYIEQLRLHREKVGVMTNDFYIEQGVVEIKVDGWEKELEEIEKALGKYDADLGHENRSRKCAYIWMAAVGSLEDLEDLFSAIMRRSQPTEGEIQAAQKNFRPDVPKQGRIRGKNR